MQQNVSLKLINFIAIFGVLFQLIKEDKPENRSDFRRFFFQIYKALFTFTERSDIQSRSPLATTSLAVLLD